MQDRRNVLVELAYTWADIEEEVRVMRPRLSRALAKATRVEVIDDEYDTDAGLVVGDALAIAPDYVPQNVDVIGCYFVRFDPKDAQSVSFANSSGVSIGRYPRASVGSRRTPHCPVTDLD
jgi:fructose-specific component phosphotransferase system IIB-like protein